jgi:hypothetical protein
MQTCTAFMVLPKKPGRNRQRAFASIEFLGGEEPQEDSFPKVAWIIK